MAHDPLINTSEFSLHRRWIITVQTPEIALEDLIVALEAGIELVQGAYSHCLFVRHNGSTRFKNEEGAHGGAEAVVRTVASAEVVMSIPHDTERLTYALQCIAHAHVHEEPTIIVTESWACLAGSSADRGNPNRYWKRQDSEKIHGDAVST